MGRRGDGSFAGVPPGFAGAGRWSHAQRPDDRRRCDVVFVVAFGLTCRRNVRRRRALGATRAAHTSHQSFEQRLLLG